MTNERKWELIFPDKPNTFCFLSRSSVHVNYSDNFSRQINPILEERIDRIRAQFLSNSKLRVFDERSYRLSGVEYGQNGLTLNIGLAKYADYIAFRSDANILQGISKPGKERADFLPNVIGNVGVIVTKDGATFSVLRNDNVSTYRGYLDFPGGHPEPVQVEVAARKGDTRHKELIRDELFDAVVREVVEDLGIENLFLDDPLLFAILLNIEDVMKPDMAFLITTPHTKEEIFERFHQHEPRPDEVAELVSFNLMELDATFSQYKKMTPIMEGTLSVLHQLGWSELEKRLNEIRQNC